MSKYSTRKVKPSTERLYEVLRKPVITEKARPPELPRRMPVIEPSRDSAMRVFSSTTPMKTNRGTASMV